MESSIANDGSNKVQSKNSEIRFVIPYGIPIDTRKKPPKNEAKTSRLFLFFQAYFQMDHG